MLNLYIVDKIELIWKNHVFYLELFFGIVNRFQDLILLELRVVKNSTNSIFGEFLKMIKNTLVYITEKICTPIPLISNSIHVWLPIFETQL